MKKPQIVMCRFCGEPVFEQYWQGEIQMREMSKIRGQVGSGQHTCSLRLRDVNVLEGEA